MAVQANILTPWVDDGGLQRPKLFVEYDFSGGAYEIVGQRYVMPLLNLVIVSANLEQATLDAIAADPDYFVLKGSMNKADLRTYLQANGMEEEDAVVLVGDGDTLAQITSNLGSNFKKPLKTLLYFARNAAGSRYNDLDETMLEQMTTSPFNAFSLNLGGTLPVEPTAESKAIAAAAKAVGKEIWPRLAFPYFMRDDTDKLFHIFDDEKVAWALGWIEIAMNTAKDTGVNGIMIDPENYTGVDDNTSVSILGAVFSKTPEETIARLKYIGSLIADMANEIFEGERVALWHLFVYLEKVMPDGYGYSINYIAIGIMERALEQGYNLYVIEGGEVLKPGYVHLSLPHLMEHIRDQKTLRGSYLEIYKSHLKLGGTAVLFNDISLVTGSAWLSVINNYPESQRTINKVEDYIKILPTLFETYEYVWIYWAGGNPYYDDLNPEVSGIYRPVIQAALG